MNSITISKNEYNDLKVRAGAYERMLLADQTAFSLNPAEKSKKKIISAFKATNKYNKKFLDSLHAGLSRSLYFES